MSFPGKRLIAVVLASSAILRPAPARAQDPDPWLGRDKLLHFGASAVIAGGSYGIATTFVRPRWGALLLGGGVSLAAGTTKELLDMAGLGSPSWKDFAWDVLGTIAGLGVAWGIDLLVRPGPAFVEARR
jgi:putative lipoprotein